MKLHESDIPSDAKPAGARAELFINRKHVGDVTLRGSTDSWGYGDFQPNDAFSEFVSLFGRWGLLLHADDGGAMNDALLSELHAAEAALDALRTSLFRPDRHEWIDIGQLNIDGKLIEWKSIGRCPAKAAAVR